MVYYLLIISSRLKKQIRSGDDLVVGWCESVTPDFLSMVLLFFFFFALQASNGTTVLNAHRR